MKYFHKNTLLKLASISLLVITALIIHSCRKDSKTTTPSISDASVAQAKTWYESAYPVNTSAGTSHQTTNSISNTLFDFSQHTQPNWKHASSYARLGKNVIEMPMDPSAQFNFSLKNESVPAYYDKKYTSTYFLLMNDGKNYEAYVMIVIADPAYVKNDTTKLSHNTYRKYDADFSGVVLYFTPKGEYLNGYAYQNGQLLGAPATSTQSIQSTTDPKLKTNLSAPVKCTDWYLITYDKETGEILDTQYLYTVCTTDTGGNGGGSSAPPPPNCTPATTPPPTVQSAGHLIVNVVAPPPGGFPPPLPPCPVVKVVDTIPDPCVQKNKVKAMEAISIIDSLNKQILKLSSKYEYGTSQNLKNLTGNSYLNTPIITQNSTNTLTPTFNWDPVNGFTIGFSHGHPDNSPPSYLDAFIMLTNLKNTTLQSAGPNAVNFYQSNVSSTIVTKSGTYVIKVKDWGALQAAYDKYTEMGPTAYFTYYQQLGRDYASNHSSATAIDDGESAFLQLFGNAVNLYAMPSNSSDYQPVTLYSDGEVNNSGCSN